MSLFTDIETIPQYEDIAEAPEIYRERWIEYWDARNAWKNDGRDALSSYPTEAALSAEFGRVCTIGLGYNGKLAARTQKDEVKLLNWFGDSATKYSCDIIGHSIRAFDIPFLIRRMLIHGVSLPKQLKIFGVKPWDSMIIDTQEMWGCGDYKYRVKLDLLCSILGIPSPKSDTDGSNVFELFKAGDFEAINTYCKGDVEAASLVYYVLLEMDPFKNRYEE